MSDILDYSAIFGNDSYEQRLMPLVVIDKVTLENNSVSPPRLDNPHIVDYTQSTDIQGAIEYRQGAAQQNSSGCLVTVDLLIRDYIENDSLSVWFRDAEVLKYMHLKVIQSTSNELTQRLMAGDITALRNGKKTPFYEERIIQLEKNYNDTSDFYSTPASGRGLVADIPYEAKFSLPQESPQHLSYFAFCFFDIQRMIADYNLNMYGYNKKQGVISKDITSEIVIQEGEIVSTAYIFYTPEGKLWTGAVHQHNGMWMAGERHTNTPHPVLTRQAVVNYKVQDFRDIDQPLEQEINLKPVEAILNRISKSTSASEVKIGENISFFSDAFMSSDLTPQGRKCSFTFSFDYHEFIRQKSEFGKILDSLAGEQEREEMLKESGILTLKVYRNRVDDSLFYNSINSPVRGSTFSQDPFTNSTNSPVLIVETTDVRGILASVKDSVGSIRELQIDNSSGTRTFAVTDDSISQETDGLYRYSLEVKVKDGSVTFFNNHLSLFSNAKADFELYNNICSTPDYYDIKNKSFTSGLKRHYDLMGTDMAHYPWVQAPARLCSLIKMFTGVSNATAQTLYQKLFSMCNAQTGTPEGASAVAALMQKMEDILVNILGDKKRNSVDVSEKSGKSTAFEKFVLTDDHQFSSIYDSDLDHRYGINYLGLENRNEYSGPITITVSDYFSRLNAENNKYFVNSSPRMSPIGRGEDSVPMEEFGDVTTYGATYLTPAYAYSGVDNSLAIIDNPDISSNMQRYTKFGISALSRMEGGSQADFLSMNGVSFGLASEETFGGLLKSEDTLGKKSNFAAAENITYDTVGIHNLGVPQEAEKIASFFSIDDAIERQVSIGCFDLSDDNCSIVGKYMQPPDMGGFQSEQVRQIPSQIKSLFFSSDSDISKNNWFDQSYDVSRSYKTAMMFVWNYQVICKVEYLSGYQRATTEGSQVAYPVWAPLTFDILEGVRSNRRTILCKLTNYYDETYGVGRSKFSKMPIFNQYFHIASDDVVARRVSRRRTRRRNRQSLYDTLLERGASLASETKNVPRSAMRTVITQRRPRNASGDVDDPTKNLPDSHTIPNTIDFLLDEAESVCVASIPRQEAGQTQMSQGEPQTEYRVETIEGDPKQDDSYSKGADPLLSESEMLNVDYMQPYRDLAHKIIEDTADALDTMSGQADATTGAAKEEVKDFIPQWVEGIYEMPSRDEGVIRVASDSAPAAQSARSPSMQASAPRSASPGGASMGRTSGGGY